MSNEVDTIKAEVAPIVEKAKMIVIVDQVSSDMAADFLKAVKSAQSRVTAFWKPIKEAAHKAWKQTTEGENQILDPLKDAEAMVKGKILTFQKEQEQARLEQQRLLQAKADEEARKERERLEKEAAKLKTPELKAARLEQAAAVVAPVIEIKPAVVQAKGVATVKTWKAVVVDELAVPREWLIVNESALDKFAKATKGAAKIPGVRFEETETISCRIK